LEEQHITTYRPNEELVVFGPEREPRASNKPINKKIKKKEDIIMEDPITRATPEVAGKALKVKGASSAVIGAARTRDPKPSQTSGRLDGSLRVEVKSNRRITHLSESQAYRRESQSSASTGPALVLVPKPDGQRGGRVHQDSTGKARVLAPTARVRNLPANHVQHVSRSADRHSMGHVDAVEDPLREGDAKKPMAGIHPKPALLGRCHGITASRVIQGNRRR
jgi:hypothetical protein